MTDSGTRRDAEANARSGTAVTTPVRAMRANVAMVASPVMPSPAKDRQTSATAATGARRPVSKVSPETESHGPCLRKSPYMANVAATSIAIHGSRPSATTLQTMPTVESASAPTCRRRSFSPNRPTPSATDMIGMRKYPNAASTDWPILMAHKNTAQFAPIESAAPIP